MSTQETEFDLNAFFKDIGFTDEEVGEIGGKFQGDKAQKLKESVLRQSDYDRKFNTMKAALQKEKEDLEADIEAKQEEIADERKKLGTYKSQLEETTAKERIRAMVADLKIKKASELYAIDIDAIDVPEAEELAKELKTKESKTDKQDAPKSVTMDDVLKAGDYMLNVQAEIDDIKESYKELYPDKKFPLKEFLETARKNAAHRDPAKRKFINQTAEEMFDFSKVRSEKERKSIETAADDKYRKQYEEKLTQELSKQGIRQSDDDAPRSTYWKSKQEKPTTRSRDDRVREAIGKRNAA